MGLFDSLCRRYQSLFRAAHPEEADLVELHSTGQTEQFLAAYFAHEYRKGGDVVERFTALAPGWHGGRALDFGCGAGGLTYRIAAHAREAVGIDIEQYKLDFAAAQAERLNVPNARFVCSASAALPFADDSFDCVFCIDVVEHLPTPEKFVAEFRRVLRPGGQLLLSFGPPWGHAHGKHMWAKLPGWWTHLLFPRRAVMRAAGFPPHTTWEELGIHRLTVGRFERVMRRSGFRVEYRRLLINKAVAPLRFVPLLRELFIAEVVGVYRKPTEGTA
ncbi:MAG: class I SAM-dependent methyltransferase [Planctomycetes bacterium]|nr:class I SAM-dependent methyltransferase [Planctomycetota bacterium]